VPRKPRTTMDIPADQLDWLTQTARGHGISRNELLRRLILAYWHYVGRDVVPDRAGRVEELHPSPPPPPPEPDPQAPVIAPWPGPPPKRRPRVQIRRA